MTIVSYAMFINLTEMVQTSTGMFYVESLTCLLNESTHVGTKCIYNACVIHNLFYNQILSLGLKTLSM